MGKLTDLKFAFGKRKDRKGYDVLVIFPGERVECVGPYRTQREAKVAISFGDAIRGAILQGAALASQEQGGSDRG